MKKIGEGVYYVKASPYIHTGEKRKSYHDDARSLRGFMDCAVRKLNPDTPQKTRDFRPLIHCRKKNGMIFINKYVYFCYFVYCMYLFYLKIVLFNFYQSDNETNR